MFRTDNFHKEGYFCPYGKRDEEFIWFNIDHVIPRSRGGSNTYANARACCIPCNEKKAADLPSVSDNKPVPSDYEIKILKKSYNKKLEEDLPPWEPYYGF
jgi:5-methylcytosine-specific restriction endonuclease McrA